MIRSICFLLSAVTLTACVSVLPEKAVPDALYRIGPLDAAHPIAASIMVREPNASRLFAGRAIAAEGADGGMRLVPGVEWADNATRMMQAALVDSLKGEGSHVAVSSMMGAPSDYELAWHVSDFTLKANIARCRVSATLLDGGSRQALVKTLIEARAQADDDDNASRAKALTVAGRDCVEQVATFVAQATSDLSSE